MSKMKEESVITAMIVLVEIDNKKVQQVALDVPTVKLLYDIIKSRQKDGLHEYEKDFSDVVKIRTKEEYREEQKEKDNGKETH